MLISFIKMIIRSHPFLMNVGDYLRYTFTGAFGFVQCIGSLVGLIIIVLAKNNPLLILIIFCLYITLFTVAMVITFFKWRKYRTHYKRVFNSKI